MSIFTLPLLTMRLWAEENAPAPIELLLTFPLRDSSIVLGKFFAGLAVYVVSAAVKSPLSAAGRAVYAISTLGQFWPAIWARSSSAPRCFAFGFLCSTWTENQIVACATRLGWFSLFWLIGHAADFAGSDLSKVLYAALICQAP